MSPEVSSVDATTSSMNTGGGELELAVASGFRLHPRVAVPDRAIHVESSLPVQMHMVSETMERHVQKTPARSAIAYQALVLPESVPSIGPRSQP